MPGSLNIPVFDCPVDCPVQLSEIAERLNPDAADLPNIHGTLSSLPRPERDRDREDPCPDFSENRHDRDICQIEIRRNKADPLPKRFRLHEPVRNIYVPQIEPESKLHRPAEDRSNDLS